MAGNTLVLPVVTVPLLLWTAFTFTVVNLTRAFTAGNTLVLPVVTVPLLLWTAFTFTVVNLTRAFTAVQSHVVSKSLFQLESPLILVTAPEFAGHSYSQMSRKQEPSRCVIFTSTPSGPPRD